jgi:hypothetical protein
MILYQIRQNTLSTASKRYKTGWKRPTGHKEKPNKTQKRDTILVHRIQKFTDTREGNRTTSKRGRPYTTQSASKSQKFTREKKKEEKTTFS